MSTEARRASVPPRPDVPPPHPGVPPRPATPPRPAQPPTAPPDEASTPQDPAGPPRRDPARGTAPAADPQNPAAPPRTPTGPPRQRAEREVPDRAAPGPAGAREAHRREGAADDGLPSPGPGSPFFRTTPRRTAPRAQHTDAMTPPPPPASARFPDTPPQPAPRSDDTGTPARAEERPAAPPASRPAPPHDFRRTPRPTRPAGRPAPSEDSRPTGQDGATPRTGTTAPRTAGGKAPRPTAPADTPAADTPATGTSAVRPTGDAPAGPGASRPAAPGDFFSGAGPRPTGSGTRPAAPPPPPRPVVPPPPSPPVGPADASSADSAWSPLPRSWVPAPGRSRRETGSDGAAGGPRADAQAAPAVADDGPAWSPGAAVRQPAFAVPPVPAAPPATQTPRRTDGGPDGASGPDPSLSWSAPMTPGGALGATRPVVTFGRPEGYRDAPRTFGRRGRLAAATVCAVLGMGLIGGAVTGSWLVGDSADAAERSAYTTAGGLWHNVPVDQLFPPTVDGQGAGPGGADRTWTRIAVAPDGGCAAAFDPLLLKALAPVGCRRLLRATYTDATQSHVTTVGLLFTTADAAAMRALDTRFTREKLAERTDLMPRPYAAKGTVAAAFGDRQRAAWTVSVLTDAPVVVYAVSGWADGRVVDTPQPAPAATAAGATTAPAQAGLGNEAQGLADRIERGLRKTAATPSEQPS
ncbi:hypothetical protein J2X68_003937 [Streptomyces sp. 3330]|uniref:hypothetical protein n=1 Tax=Streptomyces sp. 3330 TaxID=2817755 RepID=UPI0028589EBA|nr:hypothetical protein [Streptomyces sp. 3330]MDR6977225.1 hypothetical protein [Streptomyces sp. 3330]